MKLQLIFFICALLLISCTQAPSPEITSENSPALQNQATAQPSSSPPSQLPSEISSLISKGKSVTSLEYRYDSGNSQVIQVLFKDTKIRKISPLSTKTYKEEDYYTEIYLDRSEQKAYAACTYSADCGARYNKARVIPFEQENIQTPIDVLNAIGTDARKISTAVVKQRDAIIITYANNEGQREELALDTFYGLPLEQKIYQGDAVQTTKTFVLVRVNSLKDSDVQMSSTISVE